MSILWTKIKKRREKSSKNSQKDRMNKKLKRLLMEMMMMKINKTNKLMIKNRINNLIIKKMINNYQNQDNCLKKQMNKIDMFPFNLKIKRNNYRKIFKRQFLHKSISI